jgi:hypothetical protein
MKKGMHIATHLIKIKGKIDRNIWTEEKLKSFVISKIDCDIRRFYHADLELFGIEDEIVNVWVFVSALPSEVSRDLISKWLDDHIKEDGIDITSFEIEKIFDLIHPNHEFVTLL